MGIWTKKWLKKQSRGEKSEENKKQERTKEKCNKIKIQANMVHNTGIKMHTLHQRTCWQRSVKCESVQFMCVKAKHMEINMKGSHKKEVFSMVEWKWILQCTWMQFLLPHSGSRSYIRKISATNGWFYSAAKVLNVTTKKMNLKRKLSLSLA